MYIRCVEKEWQQKKTRTIKMNKKKPLTGMCMMKKEVPTNTELSDKKIFGCM